MVYITKVQKPRNTKTISWAFIVLFGCLLLSQVLYSNRPQEINFVLLFQVISTGSFLVYSFLTFVKNPERQKFDPLILPVLIFLIYFFTVGMVVSYINDAGFFNTIEFPHRISILLIVLFLPKFVNNEKDLNVIFGMLLIMMVVILVRDSLFWKDAERLRMVGRNYSPVGIVAAIPFALGAVFSYWGSKNHKLLVRFAIMIFCLLSFLKIFLSFSRAVWLLNVPFTLASLFFLINIRHKTNQEFRDYKKKLIKNLFFIISVGLLVVIFLYRANPDFEYTVRSRFSIISQSGNIRLDEFRNAFQVWSENPILGIGFGVESKFYKGERFREQDYVHNWILQFLKSSGIVGLCIFVHLIYRFFRELLYLWRKRFLTELHTGVLIMCFLTGMNILLQGLIQTVLQRLEIYFLLSMVISLIIGIRRLRRNQFLQGQYLNE